MGKFRKRVSFKGKRWRKGYSSSSNPIIQKHRESAKSGFFQENLGSKSNLTADAVQKHDLLSGVNGLQIDDDDAFTYEGKTYKTFDTFASDFSACTNISFSKLINKFQANSATHMEMLAILAAVTEIIKEENIPESSTAYFGALITVLEKSEDEDKSIYSIITLLSMAIKTVPHSVLQLKFAETSKTLMNLLAKYAESENVALLRPILGCISVLLRAQESIVWNEASTIQMFDSILTFITYSKPKVRKAAVYSIIAIVKSDKLPNSALAHTAKYCRNLVEDISTGGVTATLHVLILLKDIMHKFPKKELKTVCESILKVMTLNNVLLTSCGLQTLHGLFVNKPESSVLPAQTNAKLLSALYDYQPPTNDSQPTCAWLTTVLEAHLNLARNDLNLALSHLPRFFMAATSLYLADWADRFSSITHTLEASVTECLSLAKKSVHDVYVNKIIQILQTALGYQYHNAWTHILHLLNSLFKVCGKEFSTLFLPVLKVLGELRDSCQFTYNNELENVIGSAIRSMGPEDVLKSIPFKCSTSDKSKDLKKSWLLPVLKDNVVSSSLNFYIEYFLPQARFCNNECERLKAENDQINSLSYDLLQSQIWSLLPSFAANATDIKSSFPIIAKELGMMLKMRKDLRMSILMCLRKLINYCVNDEHQEEAVIISKFAKNYLPILFHIYTTPASGSDEEGTRLSCYETIKSYLKLAEENLTSELFDKACEKVKDSSTEKFAKESVLDLLKALLPYQNYSNVSEMFEFIIEKLNELISKTDAKEQKKYYRLLEELCFSESEVCITFVKENVDKIQKQLITSLSKAAASSKGTRLRCMLSLLTKSSDPLELITTIQPETILCVKDVNAKCRETAYKILTTMASFMEPNSFIQNVMIGLAGNQTMITCTLLSLAAILYHYKVESIDLDVEVEQTLLLNIGVLAITSTREIVQAALSFIKVYIQIYPREKIAKIVPRILELFSQMNDDCRRHSRTKIRDILARLVRWFGADTLLRITPSDDEILKTRIKNLGKIHARKKRRKENEKDSYKSASNNSDEGDQFQIRGKPKSIDEILAESDSDFDMDEELNEKPMKKIQKKAWITEGGDDIVDFTDVKANQKITTSKPGIVKDKIDKIKKKSSDFKTGPDGRLIITDFSDSDDEQQHSKKQNNIPGLEDSDEDMMDTDDEQKCVTSKTNKKRTLSTSTTASSLNPNKYIAGGSGIHRPIRKLLLNEKMKKNKINKGPKAFTGEEYKAKKAGGDIKRKGKPDPFAYIPLSRKAINKRHTKSSSAQFKRYFKTSNKGKTKRSSK